MEYRSALNGAASGIECASSDNPDKSSKSRRGILAVNGVFSAFGAVAGTAQVMKILYRRCGSLKSLDIQEKAG